MSYSHTLKYQAAQVINWHKLLSWWYHYLFHGINVLFTYFEISGCSGRQLTQTVIMMISLFISWHLCLIHILWDIRLLRSSTDTNLFQSWVPGVTSLRMYSAPTIAAAYDRTVWLIVVITNEPPGWNIKFKQLKIGLLKIQKWCNNMLTKCFFPCSKREIANKQWQQQHQRQCLVKYEFTFHPWILF